MTLVLKTKALLVNLIDRNKRETILPDGATPEIAEFPTIYRHG